MNTQQLRMWQAAGELVQLVYRLADELPPIERYVAGQQLRRAAWSVQNNIAEGHAKRGRPERRRFFGIALGSLAEVDSMVSTLSEMYRPDLRRVAATETLRRQITAGVLKLIERGRP